MLYVTLGFSALLPLFFSVSTLSNAWTSHSEARRVTAVAEAVRHLYNTAVAVRLERGNGLVALAAAAPAADNGRILSARNDVMAAFALSEPALRAIGRQAQAERLAAAHAAMAQLRPAVDAAVRLPLAQRQAGLAGDWAQVAITFVESLLAVTDSVEDSVLLHDARLDHLIRIRRDAAALRTAMGTVVLDLVTAVASAQPMPPARLLVTRGEQGFAEHAWAALRQSIALSATPEAVRLALTQAEP